MKKFIYLAVPLSFVLFSCSEDEPDPISADDCANINYTYADVSGIIQTNCVGCHSYGGDAAQWGDFSAYQGLEEALNADQANFISRIRWELSAEENMPRAVKMSDADIQKLECWIESGYPN